MPKTEVMFNRRLTGVVSFVFSGDLEQQFQILREQLYQERIKQIDIQLNDVRNDRSPDYLEPLQRLNENRDTRIQVAGILKGYRLENLSHTVSSEEQGALQHFEVSHCELYS